MELVVSCIIHLPRHGVYVFVSDMLFSCCLEVRFLHKPGNMGPHSVATSITPQSVGRTSSI